MKIKAEYVILNTNSQGFHSTIIVEDGFINLDTIGPGTYERISDYLNNDWVILSLSYDNKHDYWVWLLKKV